MIKDFFQFAFFIFFFFSNIIEMDVSSKKDLN